VLALRRDRMTTVRTVVDGLTDESLTAHTEPVDGVGWPPPESFPVRECLLIVLNEEWHPSAVRRAGPRRFRDGRESAGELIGGPVS
jgi:hypothetical protein